MLDCMGTVNNNGHAARKAKTSMNKQEYKEYEQDVADFFKREGITNLSSTYNDETGEGYMEPFFSWGPCDCCGSTLGGDRQECAGWNPTDKTVHGPFNVCPDCEYYAEYGQLDDMTMLEVEKEPSTPSHEEQIETVTRALEEKARESTSGVGPFNGGPYSG